MSRTITDVLARATAEAPDVLRPDVAEAGKALILDGVGCLVAGVGQPAVRVLGKCAQTIGGIGPAPVYGARVKTSAPAAAFVNGAALHVNDYEALAPAPTHGTSNILPPALALAETEGLSGVEVLRGVVVGWEVQSRLRAAGGDIRGFHYPGVFGCVGAAAASGSLLRLTEEEMRSAFAIAASRASGLPANTGTMVKSTHPGNAGRAGVEAAVLAKAGLVGSPDIFDAPGGFVSTFFHGEIDREELSGIESFSHVADYGFSIKAYPAELHMQNLIAAAEAVKLQHHPKAVEIEQIELHLGHPRANLSRPSPRSGLDGKFSYEYCAAVGILDEQVGISSFTDEMLARSDVQHLLSVTRVVGDRAVVPSALLEGAEVVAVTRDGERLVGSCSAFRGSIRNPMTRDERLAKFNRCAAEALAPDRRARLVDAIEHIEIDDALECVLGILGAIDVSAGP